MDYLLDVAEDATPLPTVLCQLIAEFGDYEGYHVLPRGPVKLQSAREMPLCMTDWTPPDDSPDSAAVRRLPFQGGGSLVLSGPLFERSSKKRKRVAGIDAAAAAAANAGADAAADDAVGSGNERVVEGAVTSAAAAAAEPVARAPIVLDKQGPWHVVPFLLGAHSLRHDREHGWIVAFEMRAQKSLLDAVTDRRARLTFNTAEFAQLHRGRFAYYRVQPYGINLVLADSQPVGRDFPPTVTPAEEASFSVYGHEGDDAAAGITLVYADAKGSARSTIKSAAGLEGNSANGVDLVQVSRAYRVAPPGWRADELLSVQGVRAYFQRAGRCEFGLAPCHERVNSACWRSCCCEEHCAQANGGNACDAHQA